MSVTFSLLPFSISFGLLLLLERPCLLLTRIGLASHFSNNGFRSASSELSKSSLLLVSWLSDKSLITTSVTSVLHNLFSKSLVSGDFGVWLSDLFGS